MRLIILFALAWLIVGLVFAGIWANAYADEYSSLGIRHPTNPVVCRDFGYDYVCWISECFLSKR